MVPAVLLFGTMRRVNPGQYVAKKSRTFGGLAARASASDEAARTAREKERKRERIDEARGMEKSGYRKGRRTMEMCTGVSHARIHVCIHAHTHTRRGMRLRCGRPRRTPSCRRRARLPNRAAPARSSKFCAQRVFSRFFSRFSMRRGAYTRKCV